MSDSYAAGQLVLRANVRWGSDARTAVSRTAALTMDEVVIPLQPMPAVGTEVEIDLSFPRLLAPFTVRGIVARHIGAAGPGDPPAIVVALSVTGEARVQLETLLRLPSHPPPRDDERKYTILIVEDNTLIRDMFAYGVKKYFQNRRGVQVQLATNADEAWSLLVGNTFDLAIVDHYLPSSSGTQLIARIRADARISALPVVAISVGGLEIREAALAAGADLFLDKPVVLRDLFSTLDRLTSLPGGAT